MAGRWLAGLLAAALLLWFVAGVANRLLPPDLSRWEQRSQVVTDAEGRLLRPFPTTRAFGVCRPARSRWTRCIWQC